MAPHADIGEPGDDGPELSASSESVWDEAPWVTLTGHDPSEDPGTGLMQDDTDGGAAREFFAIALPPEVVGPLRRRLLLGAAPLGPTIQVEVTDETGRTVVWDNATLRDKVDDASRVCAAALDPAGPAAREGGVDGDTIAQVAIAAGLLASLWQLEGATSGPPAGTGAGARTDGEAEFDTRGLDDLAKLGADCEQMILGRIRRRRDGTFSMRWQPRDIEIVTGAVADVADLISQEDPATARLFPAAYGSDEERNDGWNAIARRELVERRLESLAAVAALLNCRRCNEDQLHSLMRSLNDARLVLGTRLEVDDHGPAADLALADRSSYEAYEHITFLLAQVIRALRSTV